MVEEHLVRLSWVNVRLTAEGGHVVVAGEDCEERGWKHILGVFGPVQDPSTSYVEPT